MIGGDSMVLKYDADIDNDAIERRLKKLTNEIYKLLPNREEGLDWIKPLETLIEELAGMERLFIGRQDLFFPLLCKLEGLFTLQAEEDFFIFRRTIFDCLNLMNGLVTQCH